MCVYKGVNKLVIITLLRTNIKSSQYGKSIPCTDDQDHRQKALFYYYDYYFVLTFSAPAKLVTFYSLVFL